MRGGVGGRYPGGKQLVCPRRQRVAYRPSSRRPDRRAAPGGTTSFAAQLNQSSAVRLAVSALRAKPALEGGDDHSLVGGTDAVADGCEIGQGGGALDNSDASAAATGKTRRRPRPDPDAGAGQARPVKKFAGVAFAIGCDIRVTDNAVRRDQVAAQDVAA